MAGWASTPTTVPAGPTKRAAKRATSPAPLPTSSTFIPAAIPASANNCAVNVSSSPACCISRCVSWRERPMVYSIVVRTCVLMGCLLIPLSPDSLRRVAAHGKQRQVQVAHLGEQPEERRLVDHRPAERRLPVLVVGHRQVVEPFRPVVVEPALDPDPVDRPALSIHAPPLPPAACVCLHNSPAEQRSRHP